MSSIEKLPKYSVRTVRRILTKRINQCIGTEKTRWGLEFITTPSYRHSYHHPSQTITIEARHDNTWVVIGYYRAETFSKAEDYRYTVTRKKERYEQLNRTR